MHVNAVPGEYTAIANVDGRRLQSSFTVKADHRFDLSPEGYAAQEEATLALRDLLSQAHVMINGAESALRQLHEFRAKLDSDANGEMVETIDDAITEGDAVLALLTRPAPAMGYRDKPRLREEIRALMRAIDGPVNAPTEPQIVRLAQLREEKAAAEEAFRAFLDGPIAAINAQAADMPQILVGTAD